MTPDDLARRYRKLYRISYYDDPVHGPARRKRKRAVDRKSKRSMLAERSASRAWLRTRATVDLRWILAHGLIQADLVRLLGVTRQAIRRWCRGQMVKSHRMRWSIHSLRVALGGIT